MSPVAAGIPPRSTFSTTGTKHFVQNPNADSTGCAPADHPQAPQPAASGSSSLPSSFENGGEFDLGSGFASPNGSRHVTPVSGRCRPRLVKLRKQLHGKTGTGSGDVWSDFNPFNQFNQASSQVSTDPCDTSSDNHVSDGFTAECENTNDGARCARSEEREFVTGTGIQNREVPLGKLKNSSFVFRTTQDHSETSLDNEKSRLGHDYEESETKVLNDHNPIKCRSAANKSGSNLKPESVFGRNQVCSTLNSDCNGSESSVNVSGTSFVFGASWFKSNMDPNVEGRGSRECLGQSVPNDLRKNVEDEPKSKLQNVDSALNDKTKPEPQPQRVDGIAGILNANGCEGCCSDCKNDFFVFGGSGKKTFSCSKCRFGKWADAVGPHGINLEFFPDSNDHNISSSNYENASNACSLNSVTGLQDDMQKLDINGTRNTSDHDATKCFQRKADSGNVFVFHNIKKDSSHPKPDQESISQDLMSEHAPAVRMASFQTDDASNFCARQGMDAELPSSKSSACQEGNDACSVRDYSSQGPKKDDVELSGTTAQSFSHYGFGSKQNGASPECPSAAGVEINGGNGHASAPTGVPPSDFKTPVWDPSSFKENLFPEADMKMKFSAKGAFVKDKRSKKTKGKLKQFGMRKQLSEKDMAPQEGVLHENTSSSECYSPMDFSPYTEDAPDKSSCETSVKTYETSYLDRNFVASSMHPSMSLNSRVDNLGTEPIRSHDKSMGLKEERHGHDSKGFFVGNPSSNCSVRQAEVAHSSFKCEDACGSILSESGNLSEAVGQENTLTKEFCFTADMRSGRNFIFSASPSSVLQENVIMRKRRSRKKTGVKPGKVIIEESAFLSGAPPNDLVDKGKRVSAHQTKNASDPDEQFKQGPDSSAAALQEVCEMWRLRGNQAYKNGNLPRAEDYYTRGINSVPANVASGCSMMPLVLCLSNRAATRISLERLREALSDCLLAAALDPMFFKVYLRAANCHLVLGEIGNAVTYFSKCLSSAADVCLDRRVTIDAADGLQKAKKVDELARCSAQLLEIKTSDAASSALDKISQALATSSRSEKLFRMKVEALIMLRKYEEAIRLCEQTLRFAEKNVPEIDTKKQFGSVNGSQGYSSARIWRWHLMTNSYFNMGRLEFALDLLDRLEQVGSMRENKEILESSISLAVIIRELLRHKDAGNAAFRSGRYTEAVEHYTIALSSNVESRPFAAICFCNRAAAYQALGQVADAIADCSMAMALDGNYMKAVSRRAALHEVIRDYRQASNDLERVISLLGNQGDENARQLGSPGGSPGKANELKQTHHKLSSMQEAAKKGLPLDLHVILGVKPSDSISDIKKAYRKAALKHHPDKAGQFLARSESGYEWQLWKEIAEDVHKDADRLFKVIGEAYAVLSDPTKCEEYNIEEEIRKASKESQQNNSFDKTSSPFQGTASRRSWHGNRKPNGSPYSRC